MNNSAYPLPVQTPARPELYQLWKPIKMYTFQIIQELYILYSPYPKVAQRGPPHLPSLTRRDIGSDVLCVCCRRARGSESFCKLRKNLITSLFPDGVASLLVFVFILPRSLSCFLLLLKLLFIVFS